MPLSLLPFERIEFAGRVCGGGGALRFRYNVARHISVVQIRMKRLRNVDPRTTSHVDCAPVSGVRSAVEGRRGRWADLPAALFDMVGQLLHTRERADKVELVCAQWHRYSAQGHGWGHSLDLVAVDSWADAQSVCASLKGRLRPDRLLRVRCHAHMLEALCNTDGEVVGGRPAAAAVPPADTPAEPQTPQPCASWYARDATAEIAGKRGGDGGSTRFAGLRAAGVFTRCDSLVLTNGIEKEEDGICYTLSLARFNLQAAFPNLSRLHLILNAGTARVDELDAMAAAAPTVAELADDVDTTRPDTTDIPTGAPPDGTATGAPPDGTATVRKWERKWERRLAYVGPYTLNTRRSPTRFSLPRMPHVAHLRVSCGNAVQVGLEGELSALESLQLFAGVYLGVGPSIQLPCLTHVALSTVTDTTWWKRLVYAASHTLTVLFDTMLTLSDIYYLQRCTRLRQLHFSGRDMIGSITSYTRCLTMLPALQDAGFYHADHSGERESPLYSSISDLAADVTATLATATATLSSLAVVDRSMPLPHTWHFATLSGSAASVGARGQSVRPDGLSGIALAYFGRLIN